jgi:GrxC family glutaredoxin
MQDLNHFVSGNWELFVALAIILFLLARTWIGPGAVAVVLPTETIQLINHKDALIVDVRTDKEYLQGHVMNALHIPLGKLDDRLQELSAYKNTPVVMVCRSGARSGHAAMKLKKQGFTDVHNMGGGMLAWERANLPITTDVGKPPKPPKMAVHDSAPIAAIESPSDDAVHQVLVYSTRQCPFCTRAIDLLEAKRVGFTEIRIDQETDKRSEMEARSGRTSVPQIFIGDFHVGGCDDMYVLESKGELDALLGLSTVLGTDGKAQGSAA